MDNKAFIFYMSFYEAMQELPEKDRLKLYDAIAEYGLFGELKKPLSGISKACFALIKPQIDANEKRRNGGKKGGRPKNEKPMVSDSETYGFENEKPMVLQNSENGKPKEKEKVESRKIKEKVKDIEIPNGISCAEPETASAPEAPDDFLPFGEPEPDFMPEPIPDPVFVSLPLVGNDSHEITETEVDEYKALYPAVDVEQELRNMRGWLMDNPTRRKTKRGIAAFVGNWLRKEQDRGKSAGGYTAPRTVPGRVDFQAWAEKMEAQERAKKEAAANGL